MLTLSEAELYLRRDRTRYLATASLGTWFLVSSHMLTASWVSGLIILRLLFQRVAPFPVSGRQSWSLLAAITLSTVATILWPHQDPLKMLSIAGAPENPPFGQNLFSETWYTFLLGVPALLYFVRQKQHQLWLLWFAGTWFALIVSKLLGMSFGSRFLFFQQFFLHAAIAEVMALTFKLALRRNRRKFDRPLLAITTLCIFGIVLSPQFRGAVSGRDQLAAPLELLNAPANRKVFSDKWGVFSSSIGPGDIVLTPGDESANYLAVYVGSRSVLSLFPFFVKDIKERQEATNIFLDPSQPWDARKEVLKKYQVTKVLIPRHRPDLAEQLRETLGQPIFQSDDYFVFAVEQF